MAGGERSEALEMRGTTWTRIAKGGVNSIAVNGKQDPARDHQEFLVRLGPGQ